MFNFRVKSNLELISLRTVDLVSTRSATIFLARCVYPLYRYIPKINRSRQFPNKSPENNQTRSRRQPYKNPTTEPSRPSRRFKRKPGSWHASQKTVFRAFEKKGEKKWKTRAKGKRFVFFIEPFRGRTSAKESTESEGRKKERVEGKSSQSITRLGQSVRTDASLVIGGFHARFRPSRYYSFDGFTSCSAVSSRATPRCEYTRPEHDKLFLSAGRVPNDPNDR